MGPTSQDTGTHNARFRCTNLYDLGGNSQEVQDTMLEKAGPTEVK